MSPSLPVDFLPEDAARILESDASMFAIGSQIPMPVADRLAQLCKAADAGQDVTERLRAAGRFLNERGGFNLMARSAHQAANLYPNSLNALNALWHGIGDWQH